MQLCKLYSINSVVLHDQQYIQGHNMDLQVTLVGPGLQPPGNKTKLEG